MGTTLDRALVLGEETGGYGTYVAPTRAIEFLDDSTNFTSEPTIVQGQGLRAGSLVAAGSRRVVVKQNVPGALGFECLPKGQGLLWKWLLGSGVSTLVSGTTYQQNFTMAAELPSFVAQEQWYYIAEDGTFTAVPYSWLGCMVTDWEMTLGAEIATVKANLNGQRVDTGQAAVAVTLPALAQAPFHRGNLSVSRGALTVPTASALGSAPTAITGIDEIVVSVNNNLNTDRPGSGALKGKPVPQLRTLGVKFTAEHRDNAWDAALASQTSIGFLADYSGAALSADTERLQVMATDLRVDKVTKKVDAGVPKVDVECSGTYSGSNPPLYVAIRTSDTAL